MLASPPDDTSFHVDVGPSQLMDGTDAVSRFVREHESDVKAPVHLHGHPKHGLVFRLSEQHPGRILLLRRLEAPEGVGLEQEPSPLVPRPRGPVEDREQELEVPFDRPVGHRLAAAAGSARTPLPDEPVPVPLGQRGGVAVRSEASEEHPHCGSVVPLGRLRLSGRHLFTVDVKKRLQGERLGLGFHSAVELRANEACGELVRLPLCPCPVGMPERPA